MRIARKQRALPFWCLCILSILYFEALWLVCIIIFAWLWSDANLLIVALDELTFDNGIHLWGPLIVLVPISIGNLQDGICSIEFDDKEQTITIDYYLWYTFFTKRTEYTIPYSSLNYCYDKASPIIVPFYRILLFCSKSKIIFDLERKPNLVLREGKGWSLSDISQILKKLSEIKPAIPSSEFFVM